LLTTKGLVGSGNVWHAQQARQDRKISEIEAIVDIMSMHLHHIYTHIKMLTFNTNCVIYAIYTKC
jgi:hypothetical protein